jgi:heterodisulfide reductase subunit C
MPLHHGLELIDRAGCPRATNPDELAAAIRSLISDEAMRQKHFAAAERYVSDFCAFFGEESARQIAVEMNKLARGSPAQRTTAEGISPLSLSSAEQHGNSHRVD